MIPRFRVWVRGFRGFKYCDDVVLNYPRKQIIIYTAFNDMIVEDFDDNLITSSTGLKDKNKQEIFEGDIVKLQNGSPHHIEIKVVDLEDIETLNKIKLLNRFNDESRFVEIIGNGYKNPELLEDH